MSVKTMKRLSYILAALGWIGVLITAAACGELNSFTQTLIGSAIGLALTIGGLIGSQLLMNEAEFREYKQRKCVTYGDN